MGKKLDAATNGRLSIQMYPSMQLGGEKEMIEQTQVGAIQIVAHLASARSARWSTTSTSFNMPFVFRDARRTCER